MLQRLTQADSLCPPPKYPNLDQPFNVATGTSRRPTPTSFKHLRKPELSPEDLKTIEEIREKGKGLAPEVLDSLVRGFVESKLRGVSPGADGSACAVGLERSGVEPGPARGPGPGEKKAVATAPKKRAKVRRLDVPPGDVVKEGKRLELWACWLVIFRQLYRRSRGGYLRDIPHYPRWTSRKGRYYFCGEAYLARLCGVGRWTVVQVLKQLEAENLIYTRYHGFKGRGCSIIEVPVNLKLVWKWRRQPGRQKPST